MVKLFLVSMFIFLATTSFSQTDGLAGKNNCLFGYISDDSEEFAQVINYLNRIGVNVISSCDEEYLIYISLNVEYNDYNDLFAKIEKRYSGTCYYKALENEIPRYNKCRGQYIKSNLTMNKE